MGFKKWKGNSLFSKICSLALTFALGVNMLAGYVPAVGTTSEKVEAATTKAPYRNVMYYGEWSIYAGQKYFYPSYIDGSLITHLNFAFLDVDANGDLVLCDEHADFLAVLPEQGGLTYGDPYAGVLGAMAILRAKYPNMKIGVSVGGWTRSGDFAAVAADPIKRNNFARNISKFVDYLGYDFVDIDWEYPTAVRESDPAGNGVTIDEGCPGTEADTKNFTLLMQEIRNELDALGAQNDKYYELSVAMSANPSMMAKIEYDKVLDIIDFANMMTYDLNGAWASYTAHQTALYTNDAYDPETQGDGAFSIDTCVSYLEDTYGDSIDYSKIVIGVAPYTRGWAGVEGNTGRDPQNPGLYAKAEPNSIKVEDGTTSGTYAYSDIDKLISQYGLKEYYDEKAQAAYYYSAENGYFFTCDNERSVAAKGNYVKEKGLGGLISWMASLDGANSITQAMYDSLYTQPLPAQEIKVANPNASVEISASGKQYTITLKNNETANESNTALKDAEMYKETITFPKLYIKSKSGATFSAGSQSGTVANVDGYGVIDLSSIYAAKSMKQGTSHTFTINSSNNADVSDIQCITMTRRILTTLDEFGSQVLYGNDNGNTPVITTKAPEQTSAVVEITSKKEEVTTAEQSGEQMTTAKQEETTAGTSVGTGSYQAWSPNGVAYAVGTLVSHNGKVYECIFPHSSQADWAPDATATLWKERPDLVNIETTGGGSGDSGEEETENNYTVNGILPQHMVTGYWHNFVNGSANLKLSDVPEYYDMICVAFTGNTATPGEVTFELDAELCSALGGYTKAEFIQDIKDLKAKGQHVIISVGGAEGRIEINSADSADRFANGLISIIREYGFEGVDIDLEGGAVAGVDYIADALRKVHNEFGDNFIITMAPETFYIQADRLSYNDNTTSYLRLALEIKDILTICYPQFYNSGGMNGYNGTVVNPGTADFFTSLSTMIIEAGLRPDQVALGVPSTSQAASSGYVSNDIIKTALNSMVYGTSSGSFTPPRAYPTLRGVMTWSINWDATNKYEWGKAMAAAMDALPTVEVETKPSEVTTTAKPEETTTKADETTPDKIAISDDVEINGYQISATVEGLRTVYSVESTINSKAVTEVGMVYSLADYASEEELYVGSDSEYVRSYTATSAGVSDYNFSDSPTATSYAMTMRFGAKTPAEYNATWRVRAYAKLSDGTYVYSVAESYVIFDVAEKLYIGIKMNTLSAHDYLYTNILRVVDANYEKKDFNWNNAIVGA